LESILPNGVCFHPIIERIAPHFTLREDSMSRTTTASTPQAGKQPMAAQPQGSAMTHQPSVPPEKVAARAYQKWLLKGCKHGNDKQDWLEAEAEIRAEMARTGKK
jgi:hypothetical protein